MTLAETIRSFGMMPPQKIAQGRFVRFPGSGKGRGNTAGWCRLITPTLAVYGDWSTDIRGIWRDEAHEDTRSAREALRQALREQKAQRQQERQRQLVVARDARALISKAASGFHPYLIRKGFPTHASLLDGSDMLVPMRDARSYRDVINVQRIAPDGAKRFLTGGRARGAVHVLGAMGSARTVLCEGYATGLTLDLALKRLSGSHKVVVCFSAHNLVLVAKSFSGALVATDNDESGTGERAARETGLKWIMPTRVGDDFNDVMIRDGIFSVVKAIREAP